MFTLILVSQHGVDGCQKYWLGIWLFEFAIFLHANQPSLFRRQAEGLADDVDDAKKQGTENDAVQRGVAHEGIVQRCPEQGGNTGNDGQKDDHPNKVTARVGHNLPGSFTHSTLLTGVCGIIFRRMAGIWPLA